MPPRTRVTGLAWNEEHPARKLLYDEISNGNIPLEEAEMPWEDVWHLYEDSYEFKMEGMQCDAVFKRRLTQMREQVKGHKSRAERDEEDFNTLLNNHPPSDFDHRGRPHWNGSAAQAFLLQDLQDGRDEDFRNAKEFWQSRPAYMLFDYEQFYKHIDQANRTEKYLHTLRFRQEEKDNKAYKKAMESSKKKNHGET